MWRIAIFINHLQELFSVLEILKTPQNGAVRPQHRPGDSHDTKTENVLSEELQTSSKYPSNFGDHQVVFNKPSSRQIFGSPKKTRAEAQKSNDVSYAGAQRIQRNIKVEATFCNRSFDIQNNILNVPSGFCGMTSMAFNWSSAASLEMKIMNR